MRRVMKLGTYKKIALFVFDAFVISMAFFLSTIIKTDFGMNTTLFVQYLWNVLILIIVSSTVYHLSGMYKSLWKYASFEEVFRGIIANSIAVSIAFFVAMSILPNPWHPSYFIVGYLVITPTTIGYRIAYRFIRIIRRSTSVYSEMMPRTLIIGAGHAGAMVLKEIMESPKANEKVLGFLDDDPEKMHKIIRGIPVLGKLKDLEYIVRQYHIDSLVLAIPSFSRKQTVLFLNKAEKTKCKIRILPPFYEMLSENERSRQKVRDVNIEDLLGRDVIALEQDGIKEYIQDRVVLVTGGGGSIGSEICRQVRHFGPKMIIVLDNYENTAYDLEMEFKSLYEHNKVKHKPEILVLIASVREADTIDDIFKTYRPQVVFHAAAHKHVPLMETSPKEAIKNNIFGTYNVVKAAQKYETERFVLISTDKAVNPTNIMGATKRFAERIVNAYNPSPNTKFASVRFGNVLGSNGSVIPLFKNQIQAGGPVTVTHKDITRYFMTISEACQLVIQAGVYANGNNLFVLDMGEPVKIVKLAEKMIRLSGFEPYRDIDIIFTGLRPGEKMFEELLLDQNQITKTNNEKIYIEKDCQLEIPQIEQELKELHTALETGNYKELLMKHIGVCHESEQPKPKKTNAKETTSASS